jgi:plasmid maintenance system antidote protein VapI
MASAMSVEGKVSNSVTMAMPITLEFNRSLEENLNLQSEYDNELSR